VNVRTYLSMVMAVTIIAGGAVAVELVAYNPTSLGPVGVTLWFLALYAFVQGLLTLGFYRLKRRYGDLLGPNKRFMSSWRQGMLLAAVLVVPIALSSLRQLSTRDVVLLAVLAILIEFYGRTRT
jgi:hypothetical protein